MRLYAACIFVFFLFASPGRAGDDEKSRMSLRGLKGMQVVVEHLEPEVEQHGLTTSALQTDVELKLRQAGIPMLDRAHNDVLVRDPSIVVPIAQTGRVGSFGHVQRLEVRGLRDNVKDYVDKFINAYLAVNPKK